MNPSGVHTLRSDPAVRIWLSSVKYATARKNVFAYADRAALLDPASPLAIPSRADVRELTRLIEV